MRFHGLVFAAAPTVDGALRLVRYEGRMWLPGEPLPVRFEEQSDGRRGVLRLWKGDRPVALFYESAANEAFLFEGECRGRPTIHRKSPRRRWARLD